MAIDLSGIPDDPKATPKIDFSGIPDAAPQKESPSLMKPALKAVLSSIPGIGPVASAYEGIKQVFPSFEFLTEPIPYVPPKLTPEEQVRATKLPPMTEPGLISPPEQKFIENLGELAGGYYSPQAAIGLAKALMSIPKASIGLAKALKSIPSLFQESKELTKVIDSIKSATAKTGGSTYNMAKGELAGTPHYAVSIYPERQLILDAEASAKELKAYMAKNKDLLSSPEHSLGVWKDPSSGKTYLDVSVTIPDRNMAVQLGKQSGQKAVFDLGKMEEINVQPPQLPAAQAPKLLPAPPAEIKGPMSLTPATRVGGRVFKGSSHEQAAQEAVIQRDLLRAGDHQGASAIVDEFHKPSNKGYVDAQGKFYTLEQAQAKINEMGTSPFKESFVMRPPMTQVPSVPPGEELPFRIKQKAPKISKIDTGVSKLEVPAPIEQHASEGKLLSESAKVRLASLKESASKGTLAELAPKEPTAPRSFLDIQAQQGRSIGPLTDTSRAVREANFESRKAALADRQQVLQFGIKPESKMSAQLFDYIEGGSKPESLKSLSFQDKERVTKTAEFMRKRYDELLTGVNKIREAKGLDPIKRRENYVTHYNQLTLADEFNLLTTQSAKKVEETVSAHEKALSEAPQFWQKFKNVIFNHVMRKPGEPFSRDAVSAFMRYSGSANRYIHMTPAVDELAEASKILKEQYPNLAGNIDALASYLTGHQTPLDMGVLADPGVSSEALAVVKELNRRYIEGILEANPSVPIAQFLRLVPVFAENNPLSAAGLKAFVRQISPEARAFALKNSQVLQAQVLSRLERTVGEGTIKNITNWLPQALDREMALWGWTKAYEDVVGKLGERLAVKHADAVTGAILPILSPVDTPAMLRSQTVKLFYPLMQEATVWANHAIKRIFTQMPNNPEQAGKLARWVVTATAVNLGMALTAIRHPDVMKNILPFLFPGGALGAAGVSAMKSLKEIDKGNIGKGLGGLAETAFVTGIGPARKIPARLMMARILEAMNKEK